MEGFSPAKRVKSSALTINEKLIVSNVHDALRHQHPSRSVDDIVELCSTMTGVSKRTIYRIVKERKAGGQVLAPMLSPGRKKSVILDDFMKGVIRRKVHSFYFNKKIPTIDKILQLVNDDEDLPQISRSKLWEILHELNFKWEKVNRKSVLLDKEEIICWRRKYLRTIKQYRNEGKQIYYLDETWINEGHTVKTVWQDKTIESSRQAFIEGLSNGFQAPSGKGRRLIITHIGSVDGFVEGGLLMFVSKSTADYHEEMNADVFEEYFEQMLDLIPQGSVVVMDNASYHSRVSEKLPTSAWRKHDIEQWLSSKNIDFEMGIVKTELLAIAKLHRHKFIHHVIDDMAANRGITVLRLPPYHCELNPIELVWAQVKGEVARNNTTFKLDNVKKLFMDALKHVIADNWKNCIQHVIKEEDQMCKLDHLIDETIEPFIISVEQDSESDSNF